ncbi:MAG: molybdopterin-dependent oxidoreductase, partial [Acetobacteraceae bacterium]|nr:molybdopterin-dependent oxidoreductase [Acetobacteraceae bacterium]
MAPKLSTTRRGLLRSTVAGSALLGLSACDRLSQSHESWLDHAETLNRWLQRQIMPRNALAREYPPEAISRDFRANGTTDPDNIEYRRLATSGFADWRLQVDGLVEQPVRLSLADVRALPSRTQITRHDCVEGWSCIGKWQGVRMMSLLQIVRPRRAARYLVFHCADTLEQTLDDSGRYYESIDLIDAAHPQTILAYAMNDAPLPVSHGAPLRLRLERQLGYKMAKYIMRIEFVDSFT